jgi:hypothetical protein
MTNKKLLRWIILGLLLVGALIWFVTGPYETMRRVVYVIPPGVAAGQATLEVPDQIVLTLGVQDTLVIENQDEVIHTFGPFVIAPHTTMTQRFERVVNYQGACSFHQERQMSLVVKPAPWQLYFFYTE